MNSPTNNPSFDLPGDFYRLLCQEAAVAMIATDADFNIKYWNQAAVALLGLRGVDMKSEPLATIVPANPPPTMTIRLVISTSSLCLFAGRADDTWFALHAVRATAEARRRVYFAFFTQRLQ